MPYADMINYVANIFTILGLIIAIGIYIFWRKDYKEQKAHEYALGLLKKIKLLHYEIELLRAPKFYDPKSIIHDIEKIHIPQIDKRDGVKFQHKTTPSTS